MIDSVLDVVRKEAENCDCLQGIYHSSALHFHSNRNLDLAKSAYGIDSDHIIFNGILLSFLPYTLDSFQ